MAFYSWQTAWRNESRKARQRQNRPRKTYLWDSLNQFSNEVFISCAFWPFLRKRTPCLSSQVLFFKELWLVCHMCHGWPLWPTNNRTREKKDGTRAENNKQWALTCRPDLSLASCWVFMCFFFPPSFLRGPLTVLAAPISHTPILVAI